jgi:hypothetical protein
MRKLCPGGLKRPFLPKGLLSDTEFWVEGRTHSPPPRDFVFYKHKTWKWLRKMEPPNDHCLGWEWVSRKHIGGHPAAACLLGICSGMEAAAHGWKAENVAFTESRLHLLCAGHWAVHMYQYHPLECGSHDSL